MRTTSFSILLLVLGFIPNLFAQNTIVAGIKMGICDTIFSFPTVGNCPGGLAFDGTYFYHLDADLPYIYKYDLNGQYISSLPNPTNLNLLTWGGDLDFDGTYLWVVVEQAGKLYKIDPSNGNAILSYVLPSSNADDPNNFGCAYDNGYIWTTEYMDKTLMRIDVLTGLVVDSFVINRWVLPLKIINNELYGISFNNLSPTANQSILHFDKSTGAVLDSASWCLDYSIGICMANNTLWGLSSNTAYGGTERIYKFATSSLGIPSQLALEIPSIYPNPSSGVFRVELKEQIREKEIEIYDILGNQKEFEYTWDNEIHVNATSGIYVVKIINDEKIYATKLIIK